MTPVLCSTLVGGTLGAGLHLLTHLELSKGLGSFYLLPGWMQDVLCGISQGGSQQRCRLGNAVLF